MASNPLIREAWPDDVKAHLPSLQTILRKSLGIFFVSGSAIMLVPSTHRMWPQERCISSLRIATSMAVRLSSTCEKVHTNLFKQSNRDFESTTAT